MDMVTKSTTEASLKTLQPKPKPETLNPIPYRSDCCKDSHGHMNHEPQKLKLNPEPQTLNNINPKPKAQPKPSPFTLHPTPKNPKT
jgi:hypothetical protein